MTFEEQFPSMKNTNWNLPVDEDYIKEEITLHCLDKQRVKEAIAKLQLKDLALGKKMSADVYIKSFDWLTKELGLED